MQNVPYWLAVQAGHTPVAFGMPGGGKTAMIEQYCSLVGRLMHLIVTSTASPTDYAIPFLDNTIREREDGIKSFIMAVPEWARRIAEGGKWLIFMDEFTSAASQAVHAANLHLLQERRVGNLQLPDTVQFALAANPPSIATNGQDISAAIANRLFHWQWEYDWDGWSTFMMGNSPHVDIPDIAEDWDSERKEYAGLVDAFFHRRPDLRTVPVDQHGYPTCNPDVLSGPYPSPRSWANAVDLAAVAKASGQPEDVQLQCMTGYVGAPATEFFDWLNTLDLYDPEQEIQEAITALESGDPVKIHWPGRPDKDIAHIRALINAVTADTDDSTRFNKPRWEAVAALLVDAANYAKDLAVAHIPVFAMPNGVVNIPQGARQSAEFITLFASTISKVHNG